MQICSAADTTTTHDALVHLGQALVASGHRFTTATPATHARVNARPGNAWARNAADVFGWSRPFKPGVLEPDLWDALSGAGLLEPHGDGWKSRVRASTLHGTLFLHSAFPTTAGNAVFFGPDTHRFTDAIRRHLARGAPVNRAVDIGCGAGPGAVVVARHRPHAEVLAVDINDMALRFTTVNARLARADRLVVQPSNLLNDVDGRFDFIVANPPYLLDAQRRTYRHGGGRHGEGLSLAMARLAQERLTPGGTLLMYTGSAIVNGTDALRTAVTALCDQPTLECRYEEVDPDVFGEELDTPAYADADRLAAVVITIRKVAA